MKIQILTFVLLFLTVITVVTAQNDPRAEKLLNDVEKKFKSYQSAVVDFTYKLHNPDAQINEETNGKLTVKGNKYRGEYMGIIDIFDGKKRYMIVPEVKEINIMTIANDDEEEFTPSKMFDFFKKGYRFQMDIKQKLNGRQIQYVKLFPIKENEIEYVYVGVDVNTKNINRIIIVQKNKTRITIQIRKIRENIPVSDKMFMFDSSAYQDYQINDLD